MSFQGLLEVVDEARGQGSTIEGSVSAEQITFLEELARSRGALHIAEIGFNAGFSSYAFLSAAPQAHVTSFDLVEHEYVEASKKFIDDEFPGRHTLVAGDSRESVPEFAASNPDVVFDLIFIDGGHTHDVAEADIRNMRSLANSETVVVFDDLLPHKPWGGGPVQAWGEAVEDGTVTQTGLYQDGVQVTSVSPEAARGWAVGHYI